MTETKSVIMATAVAGYVIERTAKRLKLAFSRTLNNDPLIDVTVDQWVLLQILSEQGRKTQAELAEESYKDAPTITRIIDILSKKGYVTRTPSVIDRRKYIIDLTTEGQDMVGLILPVVEAFRAKAYDGFDPEDRRVLESHLNKIENNIKRLLK